MPKIIKQPQTVYEDQHGRILFVRCVPAKDGRSKHYCTYTKDMRTGHMKHLYDEFLPIRQTFSEADADLQAYAMIFGLRALPPVVVH